ncbi:MAG: hypothetical protein AAGA48_03950 [Myxococcota bacterium]
MPQPPNPKAPHNPRNRLSLNDLRAAARLVNAALVGIVGFSGSWAHNARKDAKQVARNALTGLFRRQSNAGQPPADLWCVSGATNFGVPALAYEVSTELHIPRIGLTAREALRYKLAELDVLTLVGRRFGDESRAFVDLCDVFWMIGGGSQSEAEMRLAAKRGKPIVVVQGLGGRADHMTLTELPTAQFLDCDTLEVRSPDRDRKTYLRVAGQAARALPHTAPATSGPVC